MKPHTFHQKFCALRSSPALASLARPIKPNFFQAPVTIKKRSRHFATTCTSRQDDIMKTTIVPEIVPNKLPIENANSKQGNLNRLIGTLYEIHSIKCMKEILFMKDLVHIGKRGSQDGGIDIRGWLYSNQETATQSCLSQDRQGNADKPDQAQQLDNADHTKQERFIRVIAQCKCSRGELKIVRELEGLVGSSPTHTNSSTLKPTLGLLFASRGFTSASLARAERSPFPLVLVSLDMPSSLVLSLDGAVKDNIEPNNHQCKISNCYPNPVAVRLINPFEFIRVSKLTSDGLPAEQSWILVNRSINKPHVF
ncbi:hypothetical protein, variant [Puccinia triticina 1-1 BBBD Race 1]|uniref:Uncharacterized protein n=1 Tax=Puccinia triticina (isolate 1-1 / race 1 (BBBD)) TaxID=630390 RepID=A0A180GBX9_PUCT1|nr:hypothetical protein PTTG_02541 [Puccinia triticina 1-1 BBBD Race 1]OAV89968.1 hypothetical protein, variant [Puccinia triticina 1-1 BBBD Race 1]